MFWIQPAKTYIPSNTSRMFWHHIQCSQWKVGAMIPPPKKKKRIKVEKNEPKHFKEEDQSAGTFESFKKSPASVLRHPRCLAIENRFIVFLVFEFVFWFFLRLKHRNVWRSLCLMAPLWKLSCVFCLLRPTWPRKRKSESSKMGEWSESLSKKVFKFKTSFEMVIQVPTLVNICISINRPTKTKPRHRILHTEVITNWKSNSPNYINKENILTHFRTQKWKDQFTHVSLVPECGPEHGERHANRTSPAFRHLHLGNGDSAVFGEIGPLDFLSLKNGRFFRTTEFFLVFFVPLCSFPV